MCMRGHFFYPVGYWGNDGEWYNKDVFLGDLSGMVV
jgi:hypothetical protein